MSDGKKLYSVELEQLEAVKFNPSGKDLTEQTSKSNDGDHGTTTPAAPSEVLSNDSTTKLTKAQAKESLPILDENKSIMLGNAEDRAFLVFYNNKLGRLSQFDIKQPKNYFIGAVGGDVVAFSDKKGKIEILGNLIDKEGKKLRSNELNEQMMEKGEITIKPLQKSNRQPFYMATKETMTGMEEQEFIISIKNHKIESMQFIENMDTNVFIINKIPRDIISQIILQDFIFTQKISKDTYIKHVGKELKNNQNLRNLLLSGLNDEYLTADQKKLKDELIEFLKRDENRKDILPSN